MIRGTTLALTQRRTPAVLQRGRTRRMPVRRSQAQTQSIKLSSQKPITLPELTESLEAWRDPLEDADDMKAKEIIKDCFIECSNSLDLSYLSLSTLPDVVGSLQHIHFLSIANNNFSEIPQTLSNLANLKRLNISHNILEEVPDRIAEFKKLEFLNLESNQLGKVSEELARLPKIETVIFSHNRILKFPTNIRNIKNLQMDDQLPLASFADFSPEFAARWEESIQKEIGSCYFEMWLARYEEILKLPENETYREAYKERLGLLMDTMVTNPSLRQRCYDEAKSIVATCYNGILFSLFQMEINQIEERMIVSQLSDEEVRQEMERHFNFYRLQELALLQSEERSYESGATTEDANIEAFATALFFYASEVNTLDMPLGAKRLPFMCYPNETNATHDDVRNAVARIQREKIEHGQDYLIDFVSDKEFWVNYLEIRYTDIIAEHTQIFMDQMEQLEAKKDKITEYDYLTQMNAIAEEKNESEQRLYRQLTKNIVVD